MKKALVIGKINDKIKKVLHKAMCNDLIVDIYNYGVYMGISEKREDCQNFTSESDFIDWIIPRDNFIDEFIIIKGEIETDKYLHHLLNINKKLGNKKLLSHAAIFFNTDNLDSSNFKFIMTDGAININNSDNYCYGGIAQNIDDELYKIDNVAIITASGTMKTLNKEQTEALLLLPFSLSCKQLDTVLDEEINKMKTPLDNMPKVVLAPDINVGNAIWKSLTIIGGYNVAGIVLGSCIPAMLNSRSDTEKSYYASLQVAIQGL